MSEGIEQLSFATIIPPCFIRHSPITLTKELNLGSWIQTATTFLFARPVLTVKVISNRSVNLLVNLRDLPFITSELHASVGISRYNAPMRIALIVVNTPTGFTFLAI